MEALSPLDANVNVKAKQAAQKTKAPPAKALQREKDHPLPPPSEVFEPPSSDRKNGATYKTGRLLGKGGFAICYEGQLAGTKNIYALKIVKSHMPQKKMEQKFQTELQIHSKMRHPNIVQFHRAFTFQESTYIILELCPNGSIMDMVRKRRSLTEPEVRFYTIQIAGAIKYMHAKGIIHRDLKMGNIFLDRDMNVKIGDFGLAALLMSGKDMNAVRRTTLCGTPNYIAPEILEKGKKGHDHSVDIWSLGIIIFAMLTGRPPFQSNTQEEIYRKARERDYDWPKSENSEGQICQEAKDLVATLLQTPEERPDPDTIISHPFFSCGWVPLVQDMDPTLRDNIPENTQFFSSGVGFSRSNPYMKNLRKLCIASNVGPFSTTQKIHSSTYREVAAEEKAGLTPAVPLPDYVVYRPFDEWLKEHSRKLSKDPESTQLFSEKITQTVSESIREVYTATRAQHSANKTVPRSFAAQQRAQNQPIRTTSSTRPSANRMEFEDIKARPQSRASPMGSLQARLAMTLPTRRKNQARKADEKIEDMPGPSVPLEIRYGTNVPQQLRRADSGYESHATSTDPEVGKPESLFSPRETPIAIPSTEPESVLKRLRQFYAEVERALNSRSLGPVREAPETISTIVVKWVDYTNKFGLGYILSNGSVGCIFKALPPHNDPRLDSIPPSCLVVRDAEKHLQNRGNERYADRHQLVPISGGKIEFYEQSKNGGVFMVKVDPREFTVTVNPGGESGKLARGKDEWDDRKREKIVLWRKFANYMTVYGRDQEYANEDVVYRKSPGTLKGSSISDINVVTFYQRFGDVGCWCFADGHFQFNFPDHTKIVLSADGTWCDFYHLPLEAAHDLAQKGTLSPSALDERQHLSYSLQNFLNFMAKPPRSGKLSTRSKEQQHIDPMIQGIPEANDFRRKIQFIKAICGEWITNGGLGNSDMSSRWRLRWQGHREKVTVKIPYKHVWVTVGARNGDERKVAWFDPNKPTEIAPDIEGA